ncbi:discoidin domain-containing protein [Actinoallomurus purpureus]|uniref:discoidin domain-containing protein n=1 Tax=Actinoallomurus purpureus TaxID=478114 RepID=UPI002092C681|nr:discoidin domain-containing protein [Actinoallomurus purpureus]MCO6003616.1 discoidin domain-containing protein [Actinoallomurus purpureus]
MISPGPRGTRPRGPFHPAEGTRPLTEESHALRPLRPEARAGAPFLRTRPRAVPADRRVTRRTRRDLAVHPRAYRGARAAASCGTDDAAKGRPATASSAEGAGFAAADAVDGDTSTRWATEIAATIDADSMRMLRKERRAALLVDVARAYGQVGDRDRAVRALLEAETTASREVRCRPVAQATIADLLRRSRNAPPFELARLAERARVRV